MALSYADTFAHYNTSDTTSPWANRAETLRLCAYRADEVFEMVLRMVRCPHGERLHAASIRIGNQAN